MIIPCTCTFTYFAITIQILIHDVTCCPLRTNGVLSTFRQWSNMVIHLFLSFGNAYCFKPPNKSCFFASHVCADRTSLVTGITVNIGNLIGKWHSYTIIQSIIQTVLPRKSNFPTSGLKITIVCIRNLNAQCIRHLVSRSHHFLGVADKIISRTCQTIIK